MNYLCQQCERSEIRNVKGKKGRFCTHFTHTFLPDKGDPPKESLFFLEEHPVYGKISRECRILHGLSKSPCSGFRKVGSSQ